MTQHDPSRAIPHELLLEQAGFLRRLARYLVHDAHAADDAVQDVMVAALERPPRHDGNLHGWLGAVLRNLVSKRSRAHVRRVQHEQESARLAERSDELAPLESESTVRFVTDAVLALDEPYRSAILLRYFEDLSVQEIAKRQRVPVSTVKSRLQRALEILRTRMKRTNGDGWQASLLALTVPSKIGKGVILMSLKTKLAIASVALIASIAVYRGFEGQQPVAPEPLASETSAATVHSTELPAPTKPPLEVEGSTATTSARSSAAAAPATTRASQLFYGNLLDPDGKPIHGVQMASVTITDASGRRRTCDAKNDGAFAFNSLPAGRYWTLAWADGFRTLEGVIDLEAEHGQVQHDFTLQPARVLKIRAMTPDGRALSEVLNEEPYSKARYALLSVATKTAPGEWFPDVSNGRGTTLGMGRLEDNPSQVAALGPGYICLLALDGELPAFVSLMNGARVLQTKSASSGADEVSFVVSPEDVLASAVTIRLQVIDAETHAALSGAFVRISVVSRGFTAQSDAQGIVLLEGAEPAEYSLWISTADHADHRRRFLAQAGATTDLGQIVLDKAVALELSVVGPDGRPKAGNFSVGVLDPGSRTLELELGHAYAASAEGVLRLPGLARQVYVLRSSINDGWNQTGDMTGQFASGNLVLDLRSGVAPVKQVIRLVSATPISLCVPKGPQKGLGFRVIDDQGLVAAENRFYSEAPYPLALPPGAYRVLLLDVDKRVLSELPLTLDAKPRSVELSR